MDFLGLIWSHSNNLVYADIFRCRKLSLVRLTKPFQSIIYLYFACFLDANWISIVGLLAKYSNVVNSVLSVLLFGFCFHSKCTIFFLITGFEWFLYASVINKYGSPSFLALDVVKGQIVHLC